MVSVTSNPKLSCPKKCFEVPVQKIILPLSLTVIFGTSFLSVQSNNPQALAQSFGTQQIHAMGATVLNNSSNGLAQSGTTQNQSSVDQSNTIQEPSNNVVQFGTNQNQIRQAQDNATVNQSDSRAQFGTNQNQIRQAQDNATANHSDSRAQFGTNQNHIRQVSR